jgi:peptidoglycan/LPS O-acetylase OafA/YrhL
LQTTPPQKLYGLDHLRALAIAFVFLFHYQILSQGMPEWLPDVAKFGWTGVDLFFVLSGFLIASQLLLKIKHQNSVSFKEFFLKRFFRILPAFWVTIALYFCIPQFREKEALPPLWKLLTFTQNLGLNLRDYGTFSHAWSLCVEEHFYLLLPIILFVLIITKAFKNAYWLLLFLFVAGFVIRWCCYQYQYLPKSDENGWMYWYQYLYYPTYCRLDGLLMGVTIAAIYQFRPKVWLKISAYGNWFFLIGLAVLTAAYFLCNDQSSFNASVFGFPLVALGYGCWVMAAISPKSFLYRLQSKATTFIAALSYAIYLTHKGVIHVTQAWLASYKINDNLLLLICIVTCIAAALLMHWIVEQPFMKLRSKLVK